jgi:transposase, IS30 family
MNTTYVRLKSRDREEISRGLACKESFRSVARRLSRHPSTISREVAAGGGPKAYRAGTAETEAWLAAKHGRKRKLDTNLALQAYVHGHLRLYWSPDQISRRLKEAYPNDKTMQISPESIYTYLYILPRGELKKELVGYLRQKRKLRENRKGKAAEDGRGKIPEMLSIEERPAEVTDRIVPGHWESDLVMGRANKTAIGTLVERTTRTTILVHLPAKDATSVRRAFTRELRSLPAQMKLSMTHDQGREMIQHKLFAKEAKMKVYFAHPHSPWERGTNENTNGLIRQFFPKGIDFSTVTKKELNHVQDLLNGRPRRALDYQTPYEAFARLLR